VSLHASSTVHELPSWQPVPALCGAPWHCPFESQTSARVQELPSSQSVPAASGAWKHPPLKEFSTLQKSVVQEFPSSQFRAS
jgi:hypothetical protein